MRNLERAKKKLDKIADEIGNGQIYTRTLITRMNREFKAMKVRFNVKCDAKMKLGEHMVLSAFYNNGVAYDGVLYSVTILKDPQSKWIKPRHHAFFREVYLILAHEFRHAYQRTRRKFRKTRREVDSFIHFNKSIQENVRYLIDYDEIDAYAFETAEEIRVRCWTAADLRFTSVYRTMYSKNVKKYSPEHWKRWVCKVVKNLNNKSSKERNPE